MSWFDSSRCSSCETAYDSNGLCKCDIEFSEMNLEDCVNRVGDHIENCGITKVTELCWERLKKELR